MKQNIRNGRGFDPRRLHHKNGLLTSFQGIEKASKWSLVVILRPVKDTMLSFILRRDKEVFA